jgi:type VI secretion system protein ImpH
MAGEVGRSSRDLIEELVESGQRFEFFQAVRLLALAECGVGRTTAIPPMLRFATPLSLAFPASEILGIESCEAGKSSDVEGGHAASGVEPGIGGAGEHALRMTVGFMGITGPSGVLPTAYTELFIERRNRYRDSAAHQFLDLFSHRAISLFYEAWRKHRFYLAYEAGDHGGFTRNVLDLVGVGLGALQTRLQRDGDGVPDVFLAHFSGLLAQRPMSATNLAALVRGYFRVDATIEQFAGQWNDIPASEQTRLGTTSCVLGSSAVAGERMWDRQNKICMKLGPLTWKMFADFLPGRAGAIALSELVRFCVGHTLACDLELVLERNEVPPMRLDGDPEQGARLGYASWLHTRPPTVDADNARFALLE